MQAKVSVNYKLTSSAAPAHRCSVADQLRPGDRLRREHVGFSTNHTGGQRSALLRWMRRSPRSTHMQVKSEPVCHVRLGTPRSSRYPSILY